MVRIHSPRPNSSNTYSHSHIVVRVQTGSVLDPTLTLHVGSARRCTRVLINFPSDELDDLLGRYQEVW